MSTIHPVAIRSPYQAAVSQTPAGPAGLDQVQVGAAPEAAQHYGWLALGALALAVVPGMAAAQEAPAPPETAVVQKIQTTEAQADTTTQAQENLLAQTPVFNFNSQAGARVGDNVRAAQVRSGFAEGWQVLQGAAQQHSALNWRDACQGDASCSELTRSITQNGTTITAYTADADGFQKGDLVVRNQDGSGAAWVLRGDRIIKQTPTHTIHGFAGDENITSTETWQVPRYFSHIYPHAVMTYTKTETRENTLLHHTNTTIQKVTVRQDGSTVVRTDDAAPQIEPGAVTK